MQLLTQQIKDALPLLYVTDNIPLEDKIVICKFYLPRTYWSWYIFEGQPEDDDFCFFGMVHGHEREMGYFYLSELNSIYETLGLTILRDPNVFKIPYRQLL